MLPRFRRTQADTNPPAYQGSAPDVSPRELDSRNHAAAGGVDNRDSTRRMGIEQLPQDCRLGSNIPSFFDQSQSGIIPVRNEIGFDSLPPEILQEISVYLPDKDLGSFALLQRATRDAVIPANAGHWRRRFAAQFDLPAGKTPATIKEDYTLRKRFLTHLVHFKYGQSPDEQVCLKAIKQLIVEKSQDPKDPSPHQLDKAVSLNIQQLWRFMKKSNLLHDAFRWTRFGEHPTDRLLEVIQVFFFGWNVWCCRYKLNAAYPESLRRTAYSMEKSERHALADPRTKLVDAKGQINFKHLSHLTNFWKFHMAINDDGDLYHILSPMPAEQTPMSFSGALIKRSPHSRFGNKWQGALFCPTEVERYAYSSNHITNEVFTTPYFTGGDRLLDLQLTHVGRGGQWPKAFDKEVQARPSGLRRIEEFINPPEQLQPIEKPGDKGSRPKLTKVTTAPQSGVEAYCFSLPWRQGVPKASSTNRRINFPGEKAGKIPEVHFFGVGETNVNEPPLNVAGIVHPLPLQSGIPGWQRFTMVAYETPASGSAQQGYLDADEGDLCAYLRFEGVVLPGDSIIIGRYSLGDEYRDDDDEGQFLRRGAFVYWLSRADEDDVSDEGGEGEGKGEGEGSGDEEALEDEVRADEEIWVAAAKKMQEGN
ncbi:MAG: hypothetical protein Q9186_007650 [Xanthomendoza sp. 1 TL-2023]